MLQLALKPRKAPRQARAEATRDAIVEAAARIIAERGLAAYTTNAVAERAGVSIGSLYQYFPNKHALMAALVVRQQAAQAFDIEAAAAALEGLPLAEAVRALVRAAMAQHRDNPLLATAIDHEEARLPIGSVAIDSGTEIVRRLVAGRADLRGIDPALAAGTLPALVRAVVDSWANLDPPQLDMAEEEAVRAALGYLGTRLPTSATPPSRAQTRD